LKTLIGKLAIKFTKKEIEDASGISINNIKRWRENYKQKKTPGKRGRRVTSPALEAYLIQWIKSQRKNLNHVSVRRLLVQGRAKVKELKLDKIKLTWGWVQKFLSRNNMKLRKPTTKLTMDQKPILDAVEVFKTKISTLISTNNYDENFIINMDETSFCCESIKTKTIVVKGESQENEQKDLSDKHIKIKSTGKDKENLTVVLAGSWTGVKLRAMLVFPDKGVKKLKQDPPANLYIAHREAGSWIDREMMQKWLTYVLRPYASKLPAGKRGILILDNHRGHIDPDLKAYVEGLIFDFEPLPTNSTKYAQPMDLSVNAAFKKYVSESWEDYMTKLTSNFVTKSGYYKAPTREMKMSWISAAWEKVDTQIVSNGFNIYKQTI